MGLADLLQHFPYVVDEALAARDRHAEHLVQLRQRNDDGRGVGEADHHRVGQKVDDRAELEDAHRELKNADHEREHDGQYDELLRSGGGKLGKGGAGEERHHRYRPGGELAGRSPERADHHRQQRGVETVIRGQSGQLRVGKRLRHQHQADGDPRDQVRAQCAVRQRKPGQEGK
jgi:hypothetical protein